MNDELESQDQPQPTPPASDSSKQRTAVAQQILSGARGLQLGDFASMWRFATCVMRSGLAPRGMSNVESIVVALQYGAEMGLGPMASLQNIAVINGRPRLWGDGLLAVCRASGRFDEAAFEEKIVQENGDMVAYCTVRRLPNGKPITRSFSMSQAQRAGLTGKDAWKMYPERMLQLRARGFACRDAFADALLGIPIAELEDEDFYVEELAAPSSPDELADALTRE